MVAQHPENPDVMRVRVPPAHPRPLASAPGTPAAPAAPPPWRFEVRAADGTLLLGLHEENGKLCAEGDQSRWDEAAAKFIAQALQWSGQRPITWKDDAMRALTGR
jgi:hypothetical protein